MTITHISHFGLEKVGETVDSVIFEGNLGSCKKMAFSHGCELAKELFYGQGLMAKSWGWELKDQDGRYSGLIVKGRDGWNLVLSARIWNHS